MRTGKMRTNSSSYGTAPSAAFLFVSTNISSILWSGIFYSSISWSCIFRSSIFSAPRVVCIMLRNVQPTGAAKIVTESTARLMGSSSASYNYNYNYNINLYSAAIQCCPGAINNVTYTVKHKNSRPTMKAVLQSE